MTPKIKIFSQKFAHFGRFEGSLLTILGVKKVDFSTFSKGLVWEVFGLSFRPQKAYFWVIFELQRSINDVEN